MQCGADAWSRGKGDTARGQDTGGIRDDRIQDRDKRKTDREQERRAGPSYLDDVKSSKAQMERPMERNTSLSWSLPVAATSTLSWRCELTLQLWHKHLHSHARR